MLIYAETSRYSPAQQCRRRLRCDGRPLRHARKERKRTSSHRHPPLGSRGKNSASPGLGPLVGSPPWQSSGGKSSWRVRREIKGPPRPNEEVEILFGKKSLKGFRSIEKFQCGRSCEMLLHAGTNVDNGVACKQQRCVYCEASLLAYFHLQNQNRSGNPG